MLPYVDRDFIRSFFMTFLTLMALVQIGYLVSVLLENSQYLFGSGDSKLGYLMLYYVASVPRQVSYTIPVVTAVGVLWIYTMKARQNEILAYFSGGLSPRRLARPMILIGAIFSILAFLTIEMLANQGDRFAERIERVNIEGRDLESLTRETNVFQKGQENRFYNIRTFNPVTETMVLPIIIDNGEDWTRQDWRLEAKTGQRVTEGDKSEWVFQDAILRRWNDKGELVEYNEYPILRESQLDAPLEEELTPYLRQRFRPAQMGTLELYDWIRSFKDQNKDTRRLETFFYFNFGVPLGTFVLTLLMCGHILRPTSTGMIVGFGGGLVLISLYYLVTIAAREMSLSGTMNPMIAALGPNLVFFLLGVHLLGRTRRG